MMLVHNSSFGGMCLVVYTDVIWLLNFLVDSMLLWLTSIALKRSVRVWRMILGGFIGSCLIIMSFTSSLAYYAGNPFMKLTFSIFMVYSVFGFKRWRYFFSNLLTFYFVTFLMGGILIGVHYFIQFDFGMQANVLQAKVRGFGDPISWMFIVIGFPLAWYFSKQRINGIEMTKIQYDQLVNVEVRINDSVLLLKGLVDSGNQLYDPISKSPVMFISTKAVQDNIPSEIMMAASDPEKVFDNTIELSTNWSDRIRFIPAKTVGKQQLLIAYKPDSIRIYNDHGSWQVNKALISFTSETLSSDDLFNCIVHPKMMTSIQNQTAS